jgi:hypothetical protein
MEPTDAGRVGRRREEGSWVNVFNVAVTKE